MQAGDPQPYQLQGTASSVLLGGETAGLLVYYLWDSGLTRRTGIFKTICLVRSSGLPYLPPGNRIISLKEGAPSPNAPLAGSTEMLIDVHNSAQPVSWLFVLFYLNKPFKRIWLILDKTRGSPGLQLIIGAFDLDLEVSKGEHWGASAGAAGTAGLQVRSGGQRVPAIAELPHSCFVLTSEARATSH